MSISILSQYPFSAEFRRKLEYKLQAVPTYISMSELRGLSLSQLWARLRSIKADRLLIPLEDENARAVLPFLKIIAGLSSARQIEIIGSEHSPITAKRVTLVHDVFAISYASIVGRSAAAAANREINALLRVPRISTGISRLNKILFINANLWFGVKAGGSVGHIAGVINALAQSGYDVTYVSVSSNALIRFPTTSQILRPPVSFGFPLEYTHYRFDRSITNQISKLCTSDLGLIYQRMSLANFTGVKMSRRLGVPYVVEYNGSEAWIAKNWGRPLKNHELAVKAEDVCLKHAHVVVTISEALRQELISRGVEARRIAYYPNCIDETIFDPARFSRAHCEQLRKQYRIAPDAIVVGFIGTFGQWHGVDVLAQAIRKLYEQQQRWLEEHKIHFFLMGDGFKMPLVKEILGEEPTRRICTLTGLVSQPDAPEYLAASDILVSPHVRNADGTPFFGSPTKLFEYMAMGKAIVASDLDQIGDILRNSIQANALPMNESRAAGNALAILCRPGDVDDLIKGIQFAADHPEWRLLLGRNARAEALAKYTWGVHVRKILGTFHAVQDELKAEETD